MVLSTLITDKFDEFRRLLFKDLLDLKEVYKKLQRAKGCDSLSQKSCLLQLSMRGDEAEIASEENSADCK